MKGPYNDPISDVYTLILVISAALAAVVAAPWLVGYLSG